MGKQRGNYKRDCSQQIFAAGSYQMIPQTLLAAMSRRELKHLIHQPFTPENQDYIVRTFYLGRNGGAPVRKALADFVNKGVASTASRHGWVNPVHQDLVWEWVSMCVPMNGKNGRKKLPILARYRLATVRVPTGVATMLNMNRQPEFAQF